MQKIIKGLLLNILFTSITFTADPPPTLWAKAYGGNSTRANGESVIEIKDGGFLIAGYTQNFRGSNMAFAVRTDSEGDTLWTREYGGKENDRGYSAKQTSDEGFVIAGYKWPSQFNLDFYLIRTESSGDTLWTKTYGTDKGEECYSVDITNDGGFVLAGWTTSVNPPQYNMYMVRTDSLGDTLWTKAYGGGMFRSVKQTSDNGFILTGNYLQACILLRTDYKGDTLWMKTFDKSKRTDIGWDVLQTDDGGFIVSGETEDDNSLYINALLIRTDSKGDTLWTKEIGTDKTLERGYSINKTSDGGFIIGGLSQGDFYMARTDSLGNVLWTWKYGTVTFSQTGRSAIQTSDGGFAITGTGGLAPDSASACALLIRLDKEGTAILNDGSFNVKKTKQLSVSYEYTNNILSINYFIPKPGDVKLELYNTKGKLLKVILDKFEHTGFHTIKLNTKKKRNRLLAAGVYLLKLSMNEQTVSRKVTFIK